MFTVLHFYIYLDLGTNEVTIAGKTSVIVLRKIPTVYTGTCYLIYFDSKGENGFPTFYIGVNSNIKKEDMPRQFIIYFTIKIVRSHQRECIFMITDS